MTPLIYLTIEQAIAIHRVTVEKSGGGTLGVLEIDKLESVLAHIQNDDYYPKPEPLKEMTLRYSRLKVLSGMDIDKKDDFFK